jgi:hypothetical protein
MWSVQLELKGEPLEEQARLEDERFLMQVCFRCSLGSQFGSGSAAQEWL